MCIFVNTLIHVWCGPRSPLSALRDFSRRYYIIINDTTTTTATATATATTTTTTTTTTTNNNNTN